MQFLCLSLWKKKRKILTLSLSHLTRGLTCASSKLTEKILSFWIGGVGCLWEVVAQERWLHMEV